MKIQSCHYQVITKIYIIRSDTASRAYEQAFSAAVSQLVKSQPAQRVASADSPSLLVMVTVQQIRQNAPALTSAFLFFFCLYSDRFVFNWLNSACADPNKNKYKATENYCCDHRNVFKIYNCFVRRIA